MPAVIDRPHVIEEPPTEIKRETSSAPPKQFGECPVCTKPLYPVDVMTGIPQEPPVGTGFRSRAICLGCGTILYYCGNSEWKVLQESDLDDDDFMERKLGLK